MNIDERFISDPHDYAAVWAKYLLAEMTNGIIASFTFCTTDTDTLVSFNDQLTKSFLYDSMN